MKSLIPPRTNLIQYIKTNEAVVEFPRMFLFLMLGYTAAQHLSFSDVIIGFVSMFALMIITLWFFSQFFYRKPISIDEESLNIRGEPFYLKNIEYITYYEKSFPEEDYLLIKTKGFEERHICVYEKFYREELRLYHFIKDNYQKIELKKGA